VADGQIYDVAVTPEGDDLVMNYIAVKVMVKGTLVEKEDRKIITVKSFKAVPE
jgi:glycine cleavage system H lipoate-binding protein